MAKELPRRIAQILDMLDPWYEDAWFDGDEDDDEFAFTENAAYGLELARLLPERPQLAFALLERDKLAAAGKLVAICGADDEAGIAVARQLFVDVLRRLQTRRPELAFLYDMATDFALLLSAQQTNRVDVAASLVEQLEAATEQFANLDPEFDAEEYDYAWHPLVDVTRVGLRLMRTTTLPAACSRLDLALDRLRVHFGPAEILETLECTVHPLGAELPTLASRRALVKLVEYEPDCAIAHDEAQGELALELRGVGVHLEAEVEEALEYEDFVLESNTDAEIEEGAV